MKRYLLILAAVILLAASAKADGTNSFEFATIQWNGPNSYVILPNGKVDFVGPQLKAIRKPDKVDDRAFYMNITMNSLGSKGFEFGGISGDGNTIIMKRPSPQKQSQK